MKQRQIIFKGFFFYFIRNEMKFRALAYRLRHLYARAGADWPQGNLFFWACLNHEIIDKEGMHLRKYTI